MQILDLRPHTVRLMSSLWSQSPTHRGALDSPPDRPHFVSRGVNRIADRLIARRVAGRSLDPGGPAVISVGNLALGGTGKTPVVAALASDLAASGRKGAVLTRGFGSPLAGPLEVDPGNGLAGDEARLMASVLDASCWPVVQARQRSRGLEYLLEKHPGTEIVIVEDGHQTADLGRHLDILILDAWTVEESPGGKRIRPVTGAVFPFGPWRESSTGAERAGIWLLVTGEPIPDSGVNGQSVAAFTRSLSLRDARNGSAVATPGGTSAVLSGIARPGAFETAVLGILPQDPVLAIRHGDHADYTPRDAARIIREVEGVGAGFLVTTAKDWVKLEPFWSGGPRVLVADLKISWGYGKTRPELVGERQGALPGRQAG